MHKIHVLQGHDNIFPPQHKGDAGYDLVAASDPEIVGIQNQDGSWAEISYIEYDTEVILAPEDYENSYCLVFPRSSNSKKNLVMANSVAVIDGGYRGHIKIRFKYIVQPNDLEIRDGYIQLGMVNKIYDKGDRIAQAIFFKREDVAIIHSTAVTPISSRGDGGFGSTGK